MSELPMDEFLKSLFEIIGGMKGAGVLAIVAMVVQLLMLLLKTSLGSFAGKYQLLTVSLLTLIGGFVGLVSTGSSVAAALVNASTLAGLQVFIHQIYVQFIKKPE